MLSSIVSSMRVGSEVVFDFAPPLQLKETIRRIKESFVVSGSSLLQQLRERAYRMIVNRTFKNKDFRWTYFDPASLTRDLKRIGFADVQLFGPKELNVRYCKDRTDGLRIRNQVRLAKARV